MHPPMKYLWSSYSFVVINCTHCDKEVYEYGSTAAESFLWSSSTAPLWSTSCRINYSSLLIIALVEPPLQRQEDTLQSHDEHKQEPLLHQ
jgi:hypothetical protein